MSIPEEWKRLLCLTESTSSATYIEDVIRQLMDGRMPVAQVQAWAYSENGFIREAALRQLAQHLPSAQSLAAILSRLNDWVPQVSAIAQSCLQDYLQPQRVDLLLQCLPEVQALKLKSRRDLAPVVEQIQTFLQRPDVQGPVWQQCRRSRSWVGVFLLECLLASPRLPTDFWQTMLHHPDGMLRKRTLLAACQQQDAKSLLLASLHDRHAALRNLVLRQLMQLDLAHEERQAICKSLLLDPSPGPRRAAAWYAEQAGLDVVACYEEFFTCWPSLSTSHRMALLHEAVHHALPQAQALAESCCQDESVKLRGMALMALVQLCLEQQDERLLQGLKDPSRKIRRSMLDLLRKNLSPEGERVEKLVFACASQSDVLLDLLKQVSNWRQMRLRLELLEYAQDPEQTMLALSGLAQSLNERSAASLWICKPSAEEGGRIHNLAYKHQQWPEVARLIQIIEDLQKQGRWK